MKTTWGKRCAAVTPKTQGPAERAVGVSKHPPELL